MSKYVLSLFVALTLSNAALAQQPRVEPREPKDWTCSVKVRCISSGEVRPVDVAVLAPEDACEEALNKAAESNWCTIDWLECVSQTCEEVLVARPAPGTLPWQVRMHCIGCNGEPAWTIGQGHTYAEAYADAYQRTYRVALDRFGGVRCGSCKVLKSGAASPVVVAPSAAAQ